METEKIEIYVDGACSKNGSINSVGGWAFIIQYDNNKKEIHSAGFESNVTNQRMELLAVVKALEQIKEKWPNAVFSITVFSDSEYLVKGATTWIYDWVDHNWLRKSKRYSKTKSQEIINIDLWKLIYNLTLELKPSFQWVKGHSGNIYNEKCDDLASVAAEIKSNYFRSIRIA